MWSHDFMEFDGVRCEYWVKHFDDPSQFGIDEGRISKLAIAVDGKLVLNYDRGWDITSCGIPAVQKTYEALVERFN